MINEGTAIIQRNVVEAWEREGMRSVVGSFGEHEVELIPHL